MRGELVAIDLETTGLDPARDSIIEVGAVRMRDGQIIDQYSQLIDPGIPLPAMITHLTGIRPEDLDGKPDIKTVLPAIRAFVRDAPIIAHNISFDAAFLARHKTLESNLRIDTYDLASVLLPRAPRYNLTSLTADFGIQLENAHRALDDALATALLYWSLWGKALTLPYDVLYEIVGAARGFKWDAAPVFEAALHEVEKQHTGGPVARNLSTVFGPPLGEDKPLRPNETLDEIDADSILGLIDEGGPLAQSMPGYQRRPQQIEMARAVVAAFNEGQHIMIEAGTGTGKSIAYLTPAIAWATTNNERVVISTNTINLQEQLINKDIPALHNTLNIPFKSALLKGRGNYLCPRRLAAVRRRQPTNVAELSLLAKILVWLMESSTGDRGEISLRGPVENSIWQRLSAEDEGCMLERCRSVMAGSCPFYKARRAAESAHLLVVNHALLLSDAAMDNRVLPDYQHLILDEAHHLEDAVTNSMSFHLDEATMRRRLDDLGGLKKGLLGDLLNSVRSSVPDKEVSKLERAVKLISDATAAMGHHISALFGALRQFLKDGETASASEYVTHTRITPALRERTGFNQVQASWATLKEFLDVISQVMAQLTEMLGRLEQYDIPDYSDLVNSTGSAGRYFQEINAQLSAFVTKPDSNTIYWTTSGQDMYATLAIHSAPLHVGELVDKYLWKARQTVIMTSATLRTNNSFDYMRERLKAQGVTTLEVGSPFDYQKSTLLYIPNDIPEPTDRQRYQQAVERGIIGLADALNGRVMVLFTSYSHLRQTSQAITPRLALGDITVYDQSDGTSRQALLEGFRTSEKAVLLGTRSFWEGVDIPGESLSALVIVRLPFAVPTDPIFAARSETYINSFDEYTIPEAILRFRQGFGRLIRTATDRGVVTVFDRRITSKSYGASFLEALPSCTVLRGALDQLPDAAKDWLTQTEL